MKKKIVTLLMASVLTVMCATGCGNGNQNAADNKVDANTQDTQTESVDEDQKMADEVKREMITVASVMAAQIVQANIDTNVQHELIEKTLKEIGDSTWLS